MLMVEFLTMTKLILVIAAMAVLSAPSQAPPPAPAKTGQDDQGKANPIKQETGTNQKPAKPLSAPPEAGVSVVATYNQQAPGKNNEGEPTSNWWPVGIAILNFAATATLAVLMLFQWRTMEKHSRHMIRGLVLTRESNRQAAVSAQAARDSADAAAKSANDMADFGRMAIDALKKIGEAAETYTNFGSRGM